VSRVVILGCGYVGSHLARAALAAGRPVRVCARGTGKLAPLGALGAEIKYLDVRTPKQLPLALASSQGACVIYSIPAAATSPPGHALRGALQAAYGAGCACFIYLSSSGLYGANPDDDVWVDEDTPVAHDDPAMTNALADEFELDNCSFERLRIVTLRLAPVYGPNRGVRERLRKGDYRLFDDGSHATSRIYIDDLVAIVQAAEERGEHKSKYLVADDEPTTQGAYAQWLCERLKLPLPPSRAIFEPGAPQVAHRNRKIRNAKLKRELAIELRYPSFREGEAAIDAAEATRG